MEKQTRNQTDLFDCFCEHGRALAKLMQESAIFLNKSVKKEKRQPGYYLQIKDNLTTLTMVRLYIPLKNSETAEDLSAHEGIAEVGLGSKANFLYFKGGENVASRQSLFEPRLHCSPGGVLFDNFSFCVQGIAPRDILCRIKGIKFGKGDIAREKDIEEALAIVAALYLSPLPMRLNILRKVTGSNQKLEELASYLLQQPNAYSFKGKIKTFLEIPVPGRTHKKIRSEKK